MDTADLRGACELEKDGLEDDDASVFFPRTDWSSALRRTGGLEQMARCGPASQSHVCHSPLRHPGKTRMGSYYSYIAPKKTKKTLGTERDARVKCFVLDFFFCTFQHTGSRCDDSRATGSPEEKKCFQRIPECRLKKRELGGWGGESYQSHGPGTRNEERR